MRATLFVLLFAALFAAGCKHTNSSKSSSAREGQKPRADKVQPQEGSARSTSSQPQATPIIEPSGKVASVNSDLRFVVIDFAMNTLPKVDQRLYVYRLGQKVGELRISGQMRNSIVAADIMSGEARVGDEVRSE